MVKIDVEGYCGLVIGPKGATVKNIIRSTGAILKIENQMLVIRGTPDQVEQAVLIVSKLISTVRPRKEKKKSNGMNEGVCRDNLLPRLRATLNKLTRDDFDELYKQIIEMVKGKVTNVETLRAVVNIIFDTALQQSESCKAYARLCRILANNLPQFETSTRGKPQVGPLFFVLSPLSPLYERLVWVRG